VDLLLAGARTTTPSTAPTVAGSRNDRADRAAKTSRAATRGDTSPTRRRAPPDGVARDGRRRAAAG
jgi:hypothetical protein